MTIGILPITRVDKSESGCKFGEKYSLAHRQVEGQPSKKPKKDGDRNAVEKLKDARQFGCVFQDVEPPESSSILRKSPKVLGPIRRVRLSKAALPHANINRSVARKNSSHSFSSAKSLRCEN